MTLDWTDEAWRRRWAELAKSRATERAAHQAEVDRWMASLLEPVTFDELRVEASLIGLIDKTLDRPIQMGERIEPVVTIDEIRVERPLILDGRAVFDPGVYWRSASRPDRSELVPDPAEPDRDPG